MILASRSMILGRRPPHQDVPCPEWGEGVSARIQQWSIGERNDYLNAIADSQDAWSAYYDDQALAKLERTGVAKPAVMDAPALAIVMSVRGEDGERLFTDADAALVQGWSYHLAERLYRAVLMLNRLNDSTPEAVEVEKKG